MVKDHSDSQFGWEPVLTSPLTIDLATTSMAASVKVHSLSSIKVKSRQLVFNVHIQSKLLQHMPVMGTYSSYELGCVSRTVG